MNILVLVILLILAFDANALPRNCYIVVVGPPVIREVATYYNVRRVCFNELGGYRLQESYYTIEEINTENFYSNQGREFILHPNTPIDRRNSP